MTWLIVIWQFVEYIYRQWPKSLHVRGEEGMDGEEGKGW